MMEAGRGSFLVDFDLVGGGGGGGGAVLGLVSKLSIGVVKGEDIERFEIPRPGAGRREGGGAGAVLELLDERSRLKSGSPGLGVCS